MCQLFQLAVAGASFLWLVGNILVRGIGKSWFIGESVTPAQTESFGASPLY
jgi:hypothetical protein